MSDDQSEIPKGRTSSLLSMATKVAVKEGKALFQRQAEKRLQKMMAQADIVVDHVGKLKGAAMKAVQMITIEAQEFLPPEVLEILEKLQSQAPPFSNEKMMASLRSELGEHFGDLENISLQPIAAASIGQVYSATVNGEPVVIKIQYPGVAESVDSDLNTLKRLVKTLLFVSGKDVNINDTFEEVRKILKLETDYHNEASNLETYRKFFSDTDEYQVPQVYHRYTTEKVIVLSKVEGVEFTQWLRQGPSESEKAIIGQRLLNLYIKEFFENRLVQTDPNPANFLVNSKNQLVLLDFGATIAYSKDFVKSYQELIRTVFTGTETEILSLLERQEFISKRESIEAKRDFLEFLKYSLLPFDEKSQPFDFSETEYSNEIRKKALSFSKKIKYSAPPKQIIFLHRKLGGIFMLLKKLGIEADLTPFRNLILNKEFYQ